MSSSSFKIRLCATTVLAAMLAGVLPARAADVGEIIVTARKRQESILNVPVVETAVPQQKLQNLQVTDVDDLPKLAPGLTIAHGLLAVGTLISIRGVGTSALDPGVDSSTSLNIDGLSLSQGLALNSATFDMQQIEVLKGPQALFYGKSSPAGVIALRTADPTDRFELIGAAAYEAESVARRGELIVSGPVTDTLKLRLSTMYSAASGYFFNDPTPIAALGAVRSPHSRAPNDEQAVVRGTAIWTPSSQFDARLKMNYVTDTALNAEASQFSSCPGGILRLPGVPPFIALNEDCKLDRTIRIVSYNPAAFPGIQNDGEPFLATRQYYGTLELNYRPVKGITITSTTGLYRLHMEGLVNTYETGASTPLISAGNHFWRHEVTEELRANSDFASPVNFTAGAFYQDANVYDRVTIGGDTFLGLPPHLVDTASFLGIKTYSVFGQLRWKVVERLELAGGLRWTDETRPYSAYSYLTNTSIPVAVPRLKADNVAPEFTATWRPTDDVTLFAAYKKAYKSGSYSISTPPTPGFDNSFGDEKVKGYELGAKSRLFERQLLFNAAWYDYRYYGLQTSAGTVIDGLPVLHTVNAASARSYGVDLDAAYQPAAVEGLQFNAAINWNRANYIVLDNASCYTSQTVAEGCNQLKDPRTGLFTAQDLSGAPMLRAPVWQMSFGFNYEKQLGDDYRIIFSNNNMHSSKYVTGLAVGREFDDQYQTGFTKVDLGVTLQGPRDRWEVALIGKNITDKVIGSCGIGNYVATNLPLTTTGGATSGPAGTGQAQCFSDPGREVWLRVTFKPFS
jgi:iron complex outermembrane receptor protein